MCYGDQVVNAPNKLKNDVVPRKTRTLTITEEIIVGELAHSFSIQEPRTQQRQRSQLTIDSQIDDTIVDTADEWGHKLKGLAVDDPAVQSLLDLQKGSKASRLESLKQKKQAVAREELSVAHKKYYASSDTDSDATLYSSSSNKTKEGANESDDADEFDMNLSDDNPDGDNDAARYGVFMHCKSTTTPNSTYLSPTITISSLDFIQTLLDETLANELTNLMSHLVYIDAQTTSVVHNPEGNPELTSYIPSASEVPLGTNVDVLETKTLLQEMFPDQKKQAVAREELSVAHKKYYASSDTDSDATLYSSSSNKTKEGANESDDADESDMNLSDDNPDGDNDAARYGVFMHCKSTTTPNSTYLSLTITISSLDFIQTLLDETLANELTNLMSHPVYTDAQTTSVVHNPEGNPELTSYISSASEVPLAVQAKVLIEIKKLLPTHIPKAVANYVRTRLNTSVLEVMKNNQINLFTQSSTSTDDLSEMDLKLKLLNRIYDNKSNMTHRTNQKLYDTLYEPVCPDHDALNAQDEKSSFHKRSHDNQDSPNNRERENKKKRRKDVGEPSRSSRGNKSPKDGLTIADLKGAGLERLKQQYQNDVELVYHVSQLKAAVLTEAKWNSDEDEVSKPRTFEGHMSKNTKPHPFFYNNDFHYLVCLSTEEKYTTITKHYAARYYKQGIKDMIPDIWCKETHRYIC
nr:hypothetical protein [Tanacetum cinerariifolium]